MNGRYLVKKVLMTGLYDARGGIETFARNYFDYIDKGKIRYDFTNAREFIYFGEYFIENGAVIYNIPHEKKNPVLYYQRLKEIMKGYDAVHINILSAANILPVMAAKKSGVKKIIVHSHNSGTVGLIRNTLHFIFKPYLRKAATDFFACSELAGKWMFGEKIIGQDNFHIINNGIDIEKFKYDESIRNKIRKQYGLENDFVVGHTGRFSEQKNHSFLIDIFAEVYKKNNSARLMLVGDGELRVQIEEKVKTLGLSDAVIFCGVCDNVNEIYQAMDAFVLPSLFEGLPVVLVEVQAAGLRCVISDRISKEADISGDIKFLSLSDKPESWAESILALQGAERNKCDMSDYDIRRLSDMLEQLYLE